MKRLQRLSIGSVLVTALLFAMACTDYGQLGCSGHCSHPWDGKPGSCPQPNVALGQVGGGCGAWPGPACDSGGTCIDGTCLACGGDGQVCCGQYEPNAVPCNNGTCAAVGDFPKCDDSCGTLTPGKDKCCSGTGTKCSEGACDIDTNKCIQPMSDPCTGTKPYSVYLKDANGCAVGPFFFTADDDASALTCVAALETYYGGVSACALNQPALETNVCGTSPQLGSWPYIISTCDAADITACESYRCGNCTYTPGDCP